MTYTLSFGIALGPDHAALTLSAQLFDTTGANVGAAVTTGFVERGQGNYLWTYASIPDGFRGGVDFSSGGVLLTTGAVNPEEAERIDAKVSTRATPADVPTANATADALLDRTDGVETGRTLRQALRLMLASLAGKLNGAGTTSVHIRDTNDTKDRIIATVDTDGNRASVALDAS